MNIGLIDVDKTRFPNLALGKIAAYHRSLGDSVEDELPEEEKLVLAAFKADGLIAKKYDNAPSRISSRGLVIWLEERFDLPKNGGGILLFSDNLSRENGFTYKITAKK